MVGPVGGFPTAAQRDKETARQLAAMRDEFPGWEFRLVLGGWLAVPEGTPVIQSVDLDGVAEKLRIHENTSRERD
jgi:hypothetical protein